MKFPRDFLWGTSTSAYQIEGGIRNNWTPFFDAGKATDHYHRFREDLDIIKKLGHNAHRFSLEWSRFESKKGEWDVEAIEHYHAVLDALRERGIEPIVTLWHWCIPPWLEKEGGWLNPKTVEHFARFAEFAAHEFGPKAKFWITLNEPEIYASHAYWQGSWPPMRKGVFNYFRALSHLIKAHRAAYRAIKIVQSSAQIGIAKNNIYFEGTGVDGLLAAAARWWWNQWFLNKISDAQDFIGLNYYFHNRIRGLRFGQNENRETTDMGWEIYPEGLYHCLLELKYYGKPVYITENGLADARDTKRAKFIEDHLEWVAKAISKGIDVRGYLHWSLIDNFEWAHGFSPRFGLVEVDYTTMARKIRPSALKYKEMIDQSRL